MTREANKDTGPEEIPGRIRAAGGALGSNGRARSENEEKFAEC